MVTPNIVIQHENGHDDNTHLRIHHEIENEMVIVEHGFISAIDGQFVGVTHEIIHWCDEPDLQNLSDGHAWDWEELTAFVDAWIDGNE